MDHAIITRQYLCNVIGLAPGDQANAIISEGISALEDLEQFQTADIKTLCSSLSKPGGTIEVPNPANARWNRRIPIPGHNISALFKTRMLLTAYGAEIYEMIRCPINSNCL